MIKKAWAAQRDFLVMAAECKKPDQAVLGVSEESKRDRGATREAGTKALLRPSLRPRDIHGRLVSALLCLK